MNQKTKQWTTCILMIFIYSLLGIVGVYGYTLIFMFPLLMIPLTVFLLGNDINYKRDVLMHGLICVTIGLISARLDYAVLYLISVVLPAHLFATFYRKDYTLPQIAMYTGIGTVTVFYIYVIVMKQFGIDYVQLFLTTIDEVEKQYLALLSEMVKDQAASSQLKEQADLMQAQITTTLGLVKIMTLGLLLQLGIISGVLSTFIMTFIGRMKKWRMKPLSQFTQFRLSKWVVGLLIASMFLQLMMLDNTQVVTFSANLFFFMSFLLQIVGLISSIVMIRRSKWTPALKSMVVVLCVMMIWVFPMSMLVVGIVDTLVNFRKVDLII